MNDIIIKVNGQEFKRKILEPDKIKLKKTGFYFDSVNGIQLRNILTLKLKYRNEKSRLVSFRIFDLDVLKYLRNINNRSHLIRALLAKNNIFYMDDIKSNPSKTISDILVKELKRK